MVLRQRCARFRVLRSPTLRALPAGAAGLGMQVERVRAELEVPLPQLNELPDAERLQVGTGHAGAGAAAGFGRAWVARWHVSAQACSLATGWRALRHAPMPAP